MIWLTWRQHRAQALFSLVGLAVLAAVLVPTGLGMYRTFHDSGLADCLSGAAGVPPACEDEARAFFLRYNAFQPFGILLLLLPLLVGMFFGPSLVARELEHGTHRLLWTQSVTRRHWALVKVGLVLAGTVLLSGGYAALAYWWFTPFARAYIGRFEYGLFDLQGIVPVAYTVYAVALGVFAGTVWRKVTPAMAATLAGFIGVRVAVELARPYFLPVREIRVPIYGTERVAGQPGDWVLSTSIYDAPGHRLAGGFIVCPVQDNPEPHQLCEGFAPGAYNLQVIHPVSQYWTYQFIETGIFVACAALLLYLALRRIRRII